MSGMTDEVFYSTSPSTVTDQLQLNRRLFQRTPNSNTGDYIGEHSMDSNARQFVREMQARTKARMSMSESFGRRDQLLITGEHNQVRDARSMMHHIYDGVRPDRVIMKMDVSFLDHSHVIGKGGRSIQRVMDETGCHVHFPDSNRTSTFEKSNQVSIAGSADGVEKARCMVRGLLPLTVHYEIPRCALVNQGWDSHSAFVEEVQARYHVTVTVQPVKVFGSFFDFGQPSVIRLSIRGAKSSIQDMKTGIACLLKYLTAGVYNFESTPVSLDTEVAAQHHSFVAGRNNNNLIMIGQQTDAIISLPDQASFPFIGPAASTLPNRKSTVNIKGPNFESVYRAWNELMGFLPLTLIFDTKEGQEIDPRLVSGLMEKLKISIMVRPKPRQNNFAVTVRGTEKDSRVLFDVRRQLLNLDESEVPFCCGQHYLRTLSASYSDENQRVSEFQRPSVASCISCNGRRESCNSCGDQSFAGSPLALNNSFNQLNSVRSIWATNGQDAPLRQMNTQSLSCFPDIWSNNSCGIGECRSEREEFSHTYRQPVLPTLEGRESLTQALINSNLERYVEHFSKLTMERFLSLTNQDLATIPYKDREQILTLATQLRWDAKDNDRQSLGY